MDELFCFLFLFCKKVYTRFCVVIWTQWENKISQLRFIAVVFSSRWFWVEPLLKSCRLRENGLEWLLKTVRNFLKFFGMEWAYFFLGEDSEYGHLPLVDDQLWASLILYESLFWVLRRPSSTILYPLHRTFACFTDRKERSYFSDVLKTDERIGFSASYILCLSLASGATFLLHYALPSWIRLLFCFWCLHTCFKAFCYFAWNAALKLVASY